MPAERRMTEEANATFQNGEAGETQEQHQQEQPLESEDEEESNWMTGHRQEDEEAASNAEQHENKPDEEDDDDFMDVDYGYENVGNDSAHIRQMKEAANLRRTAARTSRYAARSSMARFKQSQLTMLASSDTQKNRNVTRRHVVTATDTPFEMSYHPERRFLVYCPPFQRQQWNDTQVLPRVNWGDLFFDLHYVAATYNVSAIVVQDPSMTGLLYASGTFLPIMSMWVQNTIFSARFAVDDDLYHRCVQIVLLVLLATAVLHIRPVEIMQDAEHEISIFVFGLVLCLERLLVICNYIELYFWGIGQPDVLRAMAKREIFMILLPLGFFAAATLVAALEFFPRHEAEDEHHRFLAGEDEKKAVDDDDSTSTITHVPIWLILAGFCAQMAWAAITVVFLFPKGGKHKELMVPLNVDFLIHRTGEWTMLMLGESIFSILIVDVSDETRGYFGTFYSSILTVILLQYLHFKSQPHTAENHASRRDKNAGMGWNALNHLYSLALVLLGAAYTFFLLDFEEPSSKRRYLAGEADDGLDQDSRRERAAHIFAGSLAIVFFCLDGMTLFHLGWKQGQEQCIGKKCSNAQKRRYHWGALALLMLRVALIGFTATLSQWTVDPETLALLGLTCVVMQLGLRKVGSFLQRQQEQKKQHHGGGSSMQVRHQAPGAPASWPNVTVAQSMTVTSAEKVSPADPMPQTSNSSNGTTTEDEKINTSPMMESQDNNDDDDNNIQ